MPVSGGERVKISAWVRHEGVPPGQGTVIGIAEFTNAQGGNTEVAKIGVADISQPQREWVEISGTVRVPEQAAFLRIRLGFSYSHGTCWWDDVSVQFEEKLVARLGLASGLLSPALGGLPVEIINRDKESATLAIAAACDQPVVVHLDHAEDVRPVLAQLDVFGYPLDADTSATGELSLQEAMHAGIPPVVSCRWRFLERFRP